MEIGGQSSRKSRAESITFPVCMWLKSLTSEYLAQLHLGDLPPLFPHCSLYAGLQAEQSLDSGLQKNKEQLSCLVQLGLGGLGAQRRPHRGGVTVWGFGRWLGSSVEDTEGDM